MRRRPLQSDVPAILWQIGPIETCLHSQAVSLPRRFARLIAHLRQYYPARHEVVAIHCSPHPIVPATILRFALEDMGGHAAEIHGGFTLYVQRYNYNQAQEASILAGTNLISGSSWVNHVTIGKSAQARSRRTTLGYVGLVIRVSRSHDERLISAGVNLCCFAQTAPHVGAKKAPPSAGDMKRRGRLV